MLRADLTAMVVREFSGTLVASAPLALCADNGVMIAMAAHFSAEQKQYTPWERVRANPGWELVE